jgi:hypothetical protein
VTAPGEVGARAPGRTFDAARRNLIRKERLQIPRRLDCPSTP